MLVLLALLGLPAHAQSAAADGFDAQGLVVAAYDGDLRDPLRVSRPGRMDAWDWFAGVVLAYSNAPLVRYDTVGDERIRTPLLDHVVALHVSAGVTFHPRIRLDLTAPVVFTATGPQGAPGGPAFGDLRASALVPILIPDEDDEGLGLGVVARLDLPTGDPSRFLGNRTVAGGGSVTASYAWRDLTATAEVGAQFRPSVDLANHEGRDSVLVGLALGYRVHETTALTLESTLDLAVPAPNPRLSQSPVELTLTARHRRPVGAHVLVGLSAGLTPGAGAARARLFLGGGFGHALVREVPDTDGDGLLDDVDACPEAAEVVNRYDDADGCPDALARLQVQPRFEGAPLANAEVALGPPEEPPTWTWRSSATAYVRTGLMPGTTWDADVTAGPCLAGFDSVTLAEGDNVFDIHLRPIRTARVRYEFVRPDGAPVRFASAEWRTENPGCAAPEGYALGADGVLEHPIGVGRHTVFVEAPGFRIHREEVRFDAGEARTVRVVLTPTRVALGQGAIEILDPVTFELGSDRIAPESLPLLDEVATAILATDVGALRVEGHTDDQGDAEANLVLSQRRAEAVVAYLVGQGVPAERLRAVGHGAAQPVADNATAAGRAKNRRVVFAIEEAR